ncbi:LexA family transcriptional regulator [Campylobacter sp. RM13119]|uniref:XRE family transcriptional regulator n=1 Tax=Campylobacter TaxID=194 RepID=UPI001474C87B|nr:MULTISPECIES: LexA family transcriptional regulator [unclassified Campylobacter]MBE3607091.1 LexA family transcriptional regulator [Campylobacter sp. RM13119]
MVGDKIRELRQANGLSQKDFAKQFKIAYGTLQSYEYGETEPKPTLLKNIANFFKIDMSYFYESDSRQYVVKINDKHVVNMSSNDKNSVVNPSNLKKLQIEQIESDQIYIRQLSSSVGAGESVDIDGIEIYDTDVFVPFSKMLFKVRPKNIDHVRCMRVDGYSMAPMLFPDSWVIADVTSKFSGDGLYIVNYCGNFMVKLLQKAPDGTLSIISTNKDYKSYEIGPDDQTEVYIVGKVLRCVI